MKTIHSLVVENVQSKVPRIMALLALAVMMLVGLAGCNSGARSPAGVDPTGVYTLVSMNGKTLPCQLTHAGADMTIKSGVFTINADGTCQSLMRFSVAGREDAEREVKATYSQNDAQLTMKWERAGTTVGKVGSNTFTMTNEGMALSYQK